MTITFDQTIEDYMAFNYYYSWSSSEKKEARVIFPLIPLLCFFLVVFAAKGLNFSRYGLAEILLFAFGIFMILSFGWWVKLYISRMVRRLVASGKNTNMLGVRTLHLEEDKLIAQTEDSKSEIMWSAFEKVRETKEHFFLFLHVNQAIIVPKKAIDPPEQIDTFRNFILPKVR